MNGWYGVDLDRTLARFESGQGIDTIGEPLAPMVNRVKLWIESGRDVRIMTARVSGDDHDENLRQYEMIEDWCQEHLGTTLRITYKKDFELIELWDDRAVAVLPNIGVPIDEIDTLVAIESDAYVTLHQGNIHVNMVPGPSGNENEYRMTQREALVLASRLLRAIGAA